MTRRSSWPLVLVAAFVTACGSTVQVSGTGVIGGGTGTTGGDGLGQPTAPGAPLSGTTGAVTGPGTGAVVGPGTTGATGTTGTSGATGTTGTTGATVDVGRNGPGVTATEIRVGMIHDVNAGAVNEAVGVGAITPGDAKANATAIIKDINARGGVAGRKLVAVYANFDSNSTQTLDQQYAAVCAKLTKDTPVFAFVGTALRDSFIECMTRAGVVFLSQSLPQFGTRVFRSRPAFIETGYPNVDRLAAFHLQPLVQQKYFTPWNSATAQPAAAGQVKVGVLTLDDDVFGPAVDQVLAPAIRKLGFTVQVQKIAPLSTASDAGAQAAAVKAAQLSFAANGVTHVIPFESNGNLGTFFLPHSRSQAYYPRYGVYSGSAVEALMEAGVADPRQMNGAVGYGWMPSVDLRRQDNPETARWSNPNRRHCLKVMRANGISFDSGNAEGVALNDCAGLYLLQRAAGLVKGALNMVAFVRVTEQLGRSYQPAGSVGIGFAPNRNDPSDRAYLWRFEPGCTCFRYTGSPIAIP